MHAHPHTCMHGHTHMIATKFNHHLPLYMSLVPDRKAGAVDVKSVFKGMPFPLSPFWGRSSDDMGGVNNSDIGGPHLAISAMVSRHLSANLHFTPSAPTVMGSVGPAKNQSAAWQSRSAPAAFLAIVLETLHPLGMFDCHQVSVSVMMAVNRQYITADGFCQWDLICLLFRHCEASSIWTDTCSSVKVFDCEDCFHVDFTIRKAEEWGPCPEWSLEGQIHSAQVSPRVSGQKSVFVRFVSSGTCEISVCHTE